MDSNPYTSPRTRSDSSRNAYSVATFLGLSGLLYPIVLSAGVLVTCYFASISNAAPTGLQFDSHRIIAWRPAVVAHDLTGILLLASPVALLVSGTTLLSERRFVRRVFAATVLLWAVFAVVLWLADIDILTWYA